MVKLKAGQLLEGHMSAADLCISQLGDSDIFVLLCFCGKFIPGALSSYEWSLRLIWTLKVTNTIQTQAEKYTVITEQ